MKQPVQLNLFPEDGDLEELKALREKFNYHIMNYGVNNERTSHLRQILILGHRIARIRMSLGI